MRNTNPLVVNVCTFPPLCAFFHHPPENCFCFSNCNNSYHDGPALFENRRKTCKLAAMLLKRLLSHFFAVVHSLRSILQVRTNMKCLCFSCRKILRKVYLWKVDISFYKHSSAHLFRRRLKCKTGPYETESLDAIDTNSRYLCLIRGLIAFFSAKKVLDIFRGHV